MKDFEILSHTADFKLKVYGQSLKELFRNALEGMFQSIHPSIALCVGVNDRVVCDDLPKMHTIVIEAINIEVLLIDFLSEALTLSDIYNEAYLDVDIQELSDKHIKAILKGIPIEGFEEEIKAVTYHDLKIKKTDKGYETVILFDI